MKGKKDERKDNKKEGNKGGRERVNLSWVAKTRSLLLTSLSARQDSITFLLCFFLAPPSPSPPSSSVPLVYFFHLSYLSCFIFSSCFFISISPSLFLVPFHSLLFFCLLFSSLSPPSLPLLLFSFQYDPIFNQFLSLLGVLPLVNV